MAQQNKPAAAQPNKNVTPGSLIGGWLRRAVTAVVNAVYSPTVIGKTAQGATEISNALNHQATGYSPYTAENAAHRAQFQSKDTSRGMER
jgi:hypothetical protein